MAVEQGPMSGFRDMLAEQMIPRQYMLDTIRDVYESYGFVPLKTPAIERLETLNGKGSEETDKLLYKVRHSGSDDEGEILALRFDHTVPLARVAAQYGNLLPTPYKRYVVGEVWRGERAQAGRYREFTQFDADTVGTSSPIADAEIVAMMSDSMTALGADSLIRVNNRRILDALVGRVGIDDERSARRFVGTIDKVEKVGVDKTVADIAVNYGDEAATLVGDYLRIEGTSLEKLEKVAQLVPDSVAMAEGVDNLRTVFAILGEEGYGQDQIVFDPTIARGLDYYTGIIYETTLKGAPELGSVCSGGRYDHLIEALGGPDTPAVGTSIGVDRLFDGLKKLGILKEARTPTQVLVTNFEQASAPAYMRVARALRSAGLATEVYYNDTKLGKQFNFADKMGIPYVVVMGPDELSNGTAKIKDMESGEEVVVPLDEVPSTVKSLK